MCIDGFLSVSLYIYMFAVSSVEADLTWRKITYLRDRSASTLCHDLEAVNLGESTERNLVEITDPLLAEFGRWTSNDLANRMRGARGDQRCQALGAPQRLPLPTRHVHRPRAAPERAR